jgi:putative ABC transport system permease protein
VLARAHVLLFFALRSLLQSRMTLGLLVFAVAGAVGLAIPNTANIAGYSAELLDQGITHGYGDVHVQPSKGARFRDADGLARELGALPGVQAAVPLLTTPGAVGKDERYTVAPVQAIDVQSAHMPYQARLGASPSPSSLGADEVVVGSLVASELGIHEGDVVDLRILLPAHDEVPESAGTFQMHVRAIVIGSFGASESAFVDRTFLASAMGDERAASTILLYTGDHEGAPALARRIDQGRPGTRSLAWSEDSPYLGNAVRANQALATISNTMVVVAVSIPVWALLYVNVLQRRREVGLLGALGFGRSEIFAAFLLQAFLVGVAGIVIGVGIGAVLIHWFEVHPLFESDSLVVRPAATAASYWEPALVVFAATMVAGVFPAWRASRVDPAQVLRGVG